MTSSKTIILSFILFLLSDLLQANDKKPLTWQIKNTVWTKKFESSYEEFIATLGKAKKEGYCHTTNSCLKNARANPRFYNLNPTNLRNVFADCADLPYTLRAYFSWMNDLPFSYPSTLTPVNSFISKITPAGFFKWSRGGNGGNGDIRYNRLGNSIVEKKYVVNGDNINTVLDEVGSAISTASFRTNAKNNTVSKLFRDTYPIDISKNAIKPGTILYDPNGHIAVVFEVSKNGKIFLIDAHPDNSLTAITYGEKFSRTSIEIGGGFSNWRPFSDINGEISATPNEQLPDYSLLQFQKSKIFNFKDKEMSYYEYVRNKLSVGELIYKPVTEVRELLEEICYDVKERFSAVNESIATGLQNKEHPLQLPVNIYGTDGDWENFSSPSRDARLKASIREGRNLITKMIEGHKNADPTILYDGQDLVGDLNAAYTTNTQQCIINIKKSNGTTTSINLDTIIDNIYNLSFDPYHCIELRWGLTDKDSLDSCAQSKTKFDWYNAEQGLRNNIDRDYSLKMNYDLTGLPKAPISGVVQENISLKKVIQ